MNTTRTTEELQAEIDDARSAVWRTVLEEVRGVERDARADWTRGANPSTQAVLDLSIALRERLEGMAAADKAWPVVFAAEREPVTDRQRQVLTLFRDYVRANGFSPRLSDIAGTLGIGKVAVIGHLQALERRGLLVNRWPRRPRGWELHGLRAD